MKKVILKATFCLSILFLCATASFAGHIEIRYHGGTFCWVPGDACSGVIVITWLNDFPSDVQQFSIREENTELVLMKGDKLGNEDRDFPERVFSGEETQDGSTIIVPQQKGRYSKSLGGYIIYITHKK